MEKQKFKIYSKPSNVAFIVSKDKAEAFLNVKSDEEKLEVINRRVKLLEKNFYKKTLYRDE